MTFTSKKILHMTKSYSYINIIYFNLVFFVVVFFILILCIENNVTVKYTKTSSKTISNNISLDQIWPLAHHVDVMKFLLAL